MTINEIITEIRSATWVSLSAEIRPNSAQNINGGAKFSYCSRAFSFPADDEFNLKFVNYADPTGAYPLLSMNLAGHIQFGKKHPIAMGAFEIDYTADIAFSITILDKKLAGALNAAAGTELDPWEINVASDVLGKTVPAFGLRAGQPFKEYDLIYIHHDFLFNGMRHLDGRSFDSPKNRPTNLQIPLIKAALL
ncbi:hypothetical protein [Mucilaginibacter ginsenosidivorax]|uniref:APCDD1 domain-containing protein n=1 Tax=Mucilaginibacter ginsenosidivorax TaxID=862126 RepID=A0A5B8W4U7_9SPHI|nr:hypothetical protein [Mucilaginibacter ginsenosidivorax]QEC78884.1 hypothetical protein FSB76_24120 [Mucilaginibacter ginsenosidivorax]